MGPYVIMLCVIIATIKADKPHAAINSLGVRDVKVINTQQKINITDTHNLNDAPMKKIIKYMMWAPSDQVIDNFAKLSLPTKLALLEEMNIKQYGWFLLAFSDDQWYQMWQKLPKEEQDVIPATKLIQLKMIRNTWAACSGGDIFWYAGGKLDPLAKDLVLWRDKALKRMPHFKTETLNQIEIKQRRRIFLQWVNQLFKAKKMRLLKQLQ